MTEKRSSLFPAWGGGVAGRNGLLEGVAVISWHHNKTKEGKVQNRDSLATSLEPQKVTYYMIPFIRNIQDR